MFTPEQIGPLLEALSHSDAVIVGGQAINLWSETYQKDEEPWRSLRPFTSRDLDALGSAATLLECARHVHGIDYQTAVPAALWRDTPGALNQFVISEWEPWCQEVREKVNDLVELESWLRRLRDTPPGKP